MLPAPLALVCVDPTQDALPSSGAVPSVPVLHGMEAWSSLALPPLSELVLDGFPRPSADITPLFLNGLQFYPNPERHRIAFASHHRPNLEPQSLPWAICACHSGLCPLEDGSSACSSLLSTGPTDAQWVYLNAPSLHGHTCSGKWENSYSSFNTLLTR